MAAGQGQRLPFSQLPHIIAGYLYIYSWIIRTNANVRFGRYFGPGTALLLSLYLLMLLGEVVLDLMGHRVAEQPPIVRLVFFAAIALAMAVKYKEWTDNAQELYFARAASEIVRVLTRTTPGEQEIHDLLILFWRAFESRDVINVNLALFDKESGGLRVRHVYPPEAEYDQNLVLIPGQGGSGTSYRDDCIVYIPSRHYGHAIVADFDQPNLYSLVPDCYERCEIERFKSILSVPLTAYGRKFGVLNFDASTRNMFNLNNFAQAQFFGFVMAQCLHESKGA